MSGVAIRNARVLTMGDVEGARTGAAMSDLGVVARADVIVEGDRIAAVHVAGEKAGAGEAPHAARGPTREIDAAGRVLMPGFVDAHTHACWAGARLDEWELKQRGATYLEILESGGGIMSTVRAVRAASEDALAEGLSHRLGWMLREGTTAVEVKSGYGLTTKDEMKMLRAIVLAGEAWAGDVVPTACIGHALDPEVDRETFVARTIGETLDAVHAEFPGIAVDAYCEQGAWRLEECVRLFERARELGHPVRVHADQFHALGMTEWAADHGALSVDHLEATLPLSLAKLAASGVFGVMLPCSGFQVDGRYADGRDFVDAGGKLVLATNCNPGSAPTSSMPFAIALATRCLGVTAAEAIAACTVNGAALLGLADRGRIAPGMRADLVLLRHQDERQLGYEFGGSPVDVVVCGGEVVNAEGREGG